MTEHGMVIIGINRSDKKGTPGQQRVCSVFFILVISKSY